METNTAPAAPAPLFRTVRISRADGSFVRDMEARTLQGAVKTYVNGVYRVTGRGVGYTVTAIEDPAYADGDAAFLCKRGSAEVVYFARFV